MIKFVLIALLLSGLACSKPLAVSQQARLTYGGCYYYFRPGTRLVFREKVNPFWFRYVDDRRRGTLILEVYSVHSGQVWGTQYDADWKRLRKFSRSVPCAVVDSLERIHRLY